MCCGSAAAALLAPCLVYKAENLWNTWCDGGSNGTSYNRTKQGWFDGKRFQDWFFIICLPVMKKLHGKKVIISNSLSVSMNISLKHAIKTT